MNESQCRCEAAKFAQISNEKQRAWRQCLARSPRTRNIALTKCDTVDLAPAEMVAKSPAEAAQDHDSLETDFVLNEAERIMADYIQMFPATSKPNLNPASNRIPICLAPTGPFIQNQ